MSLKGLIKDQTITIDDHKRGNREQKSWDLPHVDVHIDKSTNFPLQGKRQNVRIRIPINSKRPIKIENKNKRALTKIPSQMKKEIQKALNDRAERNRFISDLVAILKDFDSILTDRNKIRQILENLSIHFELKWTNDKIETYSNEALIEFTQKFVDNQRVEYFITIDHKKIKIGQNSGYSKLKQFNQ